MDVKAPALTWKAIHDCKTRVRQRGGNSKCSSEMRRYLEEHRWRRQPPGTQLTLIHESVGSKQD